MSIKSLNWVINRAKIAAIPSQSGSLTYSGSSQSPSWNNYSSSQLTLSGTTSGVNAGSYTATFTPKANYCWSDGSTGSKNVTWSIGKLAVPVPLQSVGLTYNGSSQSPTWANYNTSYMTIGGTTGSKVNAGTYTATFTLKSSNYQWSDGATSAKDVTWSIGQNAFFPITVHALGNDYIPSVNEINGNLKLDSFITFTMSKSGSQYIITPKDFTITTTSSVPGKLIKSFEFESVYLTGVGDCIRFSNVDEGIKVSQCDMTDSKYYDALPVTASCDFRYSHTNPNYYASRYIAIPFKIVKG